MALVLCLASLTASAVPASNAMPFGLEIGVATCDAARTKLGRVDVLKIDETDVLLTAANPSSIYEGASKAIVRCMAGTVVGVEIQASKGGMGNAGSRDAYANLNRKYKLVAGGAMPSLGNGYARFTAGNSVIELSSPHMNFDFTLSYYKKAFYDAILANKKEKEQKARESKAAAL